MSRRMKSSRTSMLVAFVVILQVLHVIVAKNSSELGCENQGLFDGIRCICIGNTKGSRCEIVEDRVSLGKVHNATIRVELNVRQFNESEVEDNVSLEKIIENLLKDMEKAMFQGFFKDVQLITLVKNNLDLVVTHDLHITIPFSNNETVTGQYQERYKEVETALKSLNDNCTESDKPLCIDGKTVVTTAIIPASKEELCLRSLHVNFIHYYVAVVEEDGLNCLSDCSLNSPNKIECNDGTCQIKPEGAVCFCPDDHKYLYTYSGCRGRVLIAAMYGGVGAAIALLLIVGIILGVFLYRKKYYY